MARVTMILNPVSGKGRARGAAPAVRAVLESAGHSVSTLTTERPGAARDLAAQALEGGCDALVTLGGDGTLSDTVDGILRRAPWPEELTVTPLPLGTGNSFVRHFGPKSGEWGPALDGLLSGRRQWIDAARVTPANEAGGETRHMVNVFGTGFMAHVADAANRRFKALGGASYTAGVVWQLARLSAPRTVVTLDGPTSVALDAPLTLVAVCNTQWTGEDMWIAPKADASDGLLDVLTVAPLSRIELIRLFLKLFKGTHVEDPSVTSYRVSRVRVEPHAASPLLVDGDVLAQTPAIVEALPRAVQLAL